ncbi:response regulator [Teichococcus aestuarii]|uniref:response regulator n=1 Tax=Teichococcus aestuarii TaxID=568898 RepID=UPI0011B24B96|nr:response regulator [Pseudoroseomonas aestuarii]
MRAGRAAVLALLMTSLLATALGLNLSLDRRRTEDRVLRGVSALAEAAAAQAAAMLNGLDQALLGLEGLDEDAEGVRRLQRHEALAPEGTGLFVLDAAGAVKLATARGREHIAGLQQGYAASLASLPAGEPALHVAPPLRGREGSILPLLRRLDAHRVGMALLPLQGLAGQYARLPLAKGARLLLFDAEGHRLAVHPPGPWPAGEKPARAEEVVRALRERRRASGMDRAAADGTPRYYAAVPVQGQPVMLIALQSQKEVMAPWWQRTWLLIGLALLATLAIGAGTVLVLREMARRLAARQAATARLEALARGSAQIAAMTEMPALLHRVGQLARQAAAARFAAIRLHEPASHEPVIDLKPGDAPPALAALRRLALEPGLAGDAPCLWPAQAERPAALSVPLRGADGAPLGTLLVGDADHAFDADDIAMLSQLGVLAGIAIRNRRLIGTLHHAAQEAESARGRVEFILESISDGFIALDSEWRFAYANTAARRMLKLAEGALPRQTLWQRYPILLETALVEQLHTVAARGGRAEFDITLPCEGGDRSFRMLSYPAGDGIALQFRETSQRQAAAPEALAGGALPGAAIIQAAGLAHDLGHLMAAMEETASRLPPEAAEAAEALRRSGALGQALSGALLGLIRSGRTKARPADPAALLRGLLGLLRRLAGPAVALEAEIPPSLPPLPLEAGQLESAAVNLVLNARAAMPQGGSLRLTLHRLEAAPAPLPPGPCLRLAVRDSGSGFHGAALGRAGEAGFSEKPGGHGLGLAAIAAFARRQGGAFRLSDAAGGGCLAELLLPWSPLPLPAPSKTLPPPRLEGSPCILLVEDEPSLRQRLTAQLQALGCAVHAAEDGPAALQLVEEGLRPDLLLTDVMLPGGLSGLHLAEKARHWQPSCAVLLISAYAVEAGATPGQPPLLLKPCTGDELAAALQSALTQKVLASDPLSGEKLTFQ